MPNDSTRDAGFADPPEFARPPGRRRFFYWEEQITLWLKQAHRPALLLLLPFLLFTFARCGGPEVSYGSANLGGQTYPTIDLNGQTWMAENLNYEVPDSWCYNEKYDHCKQYGRLYTWEAAKSACEGVGWRLPGDDEWRDLANQFGGADDDATDGGRTAYRALIEGGNSGFGAQLGGYGYSYGAFLYLGDSGAYWSATEQDTARAWLYGFLRGDDQLHRADGDKTVAHSCRCVRN